MPYKDKDKQLEFQRTNTANKNYMRRFTLLEFLGGGCAVCGESDYTCLQIDHIEIKRRKSSDYKYGQDTVLNVYMDREDTDNLQVLCANCHMKKTGIEDKLKYINFIG